MMDNLEKTLEEIDAGLESAMDRLQQIEAAALQVAAEMAELTGEVTTVAVAVAARPQAQTGPQAKPARD